MAALQSGTTNPGGDAAVAKKARKAALGDPPPTQIGLGHTLVQRNDAPLIVPYSRGCKRKALLAAGDEDAKEQALKIARARVFANSSVGSRISTLKTWEEYHLTWFGHDTPAFPLSVEKIEAVTAMVIAGEYRSLENYMSRAKDRHLELGFQWDSVLGRAASCANKAGRRGRGPAHQSAELPVIEAYQMASGVQWEQQVHYDKVLGDNVPYNFGNFGVVASFFLLREIEVSLLLAKNVTINSEKELVTILLAASKTDPTALSCSRTWGCTCGDDSKKPCPYHCARRQRQWLVEQFADHAGQLPSDLPFFPTKGGAGVDKAEVVKCVEHVATLIGLPIKLTDGKNAYGAHTFRVSGARLMAKKRVDIRVIMLLARWESEVVMRYVRETPLEGLTQAYLGAEPATESTSAWSLPAAQCDIALEQVNKLADRHEAEVVKLQKELEALVAKRNTLEAFAVPQCVVFRGGLGTVHRAAPGYQREPPGFGAHDARGATVGAPSHAWQR